MGIGYLYILLNSCSGTPSIILRADENRSLMQLTALLIFLYLLTTSRLLISILANSFANMQSVEDFEKVQKEMIT